MTRLAHLAVFSAFVAFAGAASGGTKTTTPKIRVDINGDTRIVAATGRSVIVEGADGDEDLIATGQRARKAEATVEDLVIKLEKGMGTLGDETGRIATVFQEFLNASVEATGSTGAAAGGKGPTTWLHLSRPVMATNTPSSDVVLQGFGFEQYYNPDFMAMFECTFTKNGTSETVVTHGKVVEKAGFHGLSCPSPAMVPKKAVFVVSATWVDGNGKADIAFAGAAGENELLVDMVWTAVEVGERVVANVDGLFTSGEYTCKFADKSNAKVFKITDAAFVADSKGKRLDCGLQPTGFKIEETLSKVAFEIFVKGTDDQVSYAKIDNTIVLPTCQNAIQDGTESDVNCGGECPKCGSQKTCAKNSDCVLNMCMSKKCGQGDGATMERAGLTCKQIKYENPSAKNGKYWIQGIGRSQPATKVWCWQETRHGGGWTLGLKMWYSGHLKPNWDPFERAKGSPDYGQIEGMGEPYKLDDKLIRAVIGNPNPNDDNRNHATGISAFEVMGDQSGWNAGHSAANVEYTVMRNYKARWYFQKYNIVKESEIKAELSSYLWDSNYNGKFTTTTQGDGRLNWKGQAKCGQNSGRSGAGLLCYGAFNGSPGAGGPNGGYGCTSRQGKGWQGALHWFMMNSNHDTYVYMCAGAQHSSSNQFAHRWWFRTSDATSKTA